jgi:protein gp37
MGIESKIQWTDATWNIAVGCSKVDEDCKFCYMYRGSLNSSRYDPKIVRKTKTVFNLPLKLDQPSKIFTSSLTDVFHEEVDVFRGEMWDIIRRCPQHTFQILTKRPERIIDHLPEFWEEIRDRVWLGASIGSGASIQRMKDLISPIQPGIKFLSLEPLHAPVNLQLNDLVDFGHKVHDLIHWVIIGGESGNENGQYRYRPCELEWIEHIIEQCQKFDIPVFVKQLGTHLAKKLRLTDRHGGRIEEWPKNLQIREFPNKILTL